MTTQPCKICVRLATCLPELRCMQARIGRPPGSVPSKCLELECDVSCIRKIRIGWMTKQCTSLLWSSFMAFGCFWNCCHFGCFQDLRKFLVTNSCPFLPWPWHLHKCARCSPRKVRAASLETAEPAAAAWAMVMGVDGMPLLEICKACQECKAFQ